MKEASLVVLKSMAVEIFKIINVIQLFFSMTKDGLEELNVRFGIIYCLLDL